MRNLNKSRIPRGGARTTVLKSAGDIADLLRDGDTLLVGGFGGPGFPFRLRDAAAAGTARDLTIVSNNGDFGMFVRSGRLRRLICSYPVGPDSGPVLSAVKDGTVELLLTPQGTLAEQLHAGGAGLGGVLTPTGMDTELARRWRTVEHLGSNWLLAPPLRGDVAILRAESSDAYGNLCFRRASLNFNAVMARAADTVIAEVARIRGESECAPEAVQIPGVFVDAIVVTD